MPYISQERRKELDAGAPFSTHPGELNYSMARIVDRYVLSCGTNYRTFNDVIGALDALKMEIYTRFVRPYEDKKIGEHGDVFTF